MLAVCTRRKDTRVGIVVDTFAFQSELRDPRISFEHHTPVCGALFDRSVAVSQGVHDSFVHRVGDFLTTPRHLCLLAVALNLGSSTAREIFIIQLRLDGSFGHGNPHFAGTVVDSNGLPTVVRNNPDPFDITETTFVDSACLTLDAIFVDLSIRFADPNNRKQNGNSQGVVEC